MLMRVALIALLSFGFFGCGGRSQDEVAGYLQEMKSQQDLYLAAQEDADTALDLVNTSAVDDSWIEAAEQLREARNSYNEIAVAIAQIKPPDELVGPHRGMSKSVQLFSQYLDGIQDALAEQDVSLFLGASQESEPATRALELRADWRTAVIAHAQEIDARVPPWVREVGTRS